MAERGASRGPPGPLPPPPQPPPGPSGVPTTPAATPGPSGPSPGPSPGPPGRPVRMNLYASWEVDRSSPSCVPRLLTLTLQRLVLLRGGAAEGLGALGPLGAVVIAVQLQGSKRILRSNEIPLPSGGALETELQVTFSLQYPHFLKRGSNRLRLLLQRRKRCRTRPLGGYKTLGVGLLDMAQVLQQPGEGGRALVLHRALKEPPVPVAEIRLHSLCSLPIDPDGKARSSDRSPENESEEEEDLSFSSEQDGSDDALQCQDLEEEEEELPKGKKSRRKAAASARQPNIKQKFVALLKRFRVSEEGGFGLDPVSPARMRAVAEDLAELCARLGISNPSDSGDVEPEPDDSDSVRSTPKPRLRPFFEGLSQSSSQTEIGSPGREGTPLVEPGPRGGRRAPEDGGGQDPEGLDPPDAQAEPGGPPEKLKTPLKGSKGGEGASPRAEGGGAPPPGRGRRGTPLRERRDPPPSPQPPPGTQSPPPDGDRSPERPPSAQVSGSVVREQLLRALGAEPGLPQRLLLVSPHGWAGQWVAELLRAQGQVPICPTGGAELQAVLSTILTRIQRLCQCSAQPPRGVSVAAVGGPGFLSCLLRSFVRLLGTKSPDWQGLLRFLPVPLGAHPLSPYLASLDSRYGAAFLDPPWRELFARSDPPPSEPFPVAGRILSYVSGAAVTLPLPVAEAMLAAHRPPPEEDSQQVFVPFVAMVKVGVAEDPPGAAGDGDEVPPPTPSLAVPSPPTPGGTREAIGTPPASPSMGAPGAPSAPSAGEALGLQVDYWVGGGAKSSLRGTFRSLLVSRLPPHGEPPGDPPAPTLAMSLVTRERSKKVPTLFLSKRPREPERSLAVEGIGRLICCPRHPPGLLAVTVDGAQWDDVKFFQLAAQWPTHVKHFPVGLFSIKAP